MALTLLHTINNPNAHAESLIGDTFGESAAISGNYAIVGAPFEDSSAEDVDQGKAYIFDVTTGLLVHTLNNPNAFADSLTDDLFGYDVDISGNYAIVGALREDSVNINDNQGKAYIFDVTTGLLVHTLNNPNAFADSLTDDGFGAAVSISGNYAVVSTSYEDATYDGDEQGKAYIFDVTTGLLVRTLDNPNSFATTTNDRFGSAIAISGNYVIVGAMFESVDAENDSQGKAYIFDVTTGALLHTLDNPNSFAESTDTDMFGTTVAICDNYAIVGAPGEDKSSHNAGGRTAYVYNVSTGALLHTLTSTNIFTRGNGSQMCVAISDEYIVIGAPYENPAELEDQSGIVYIYDTVSGDLLHTIPNPNAGNASATYDKFGNSVSISGDKIIVAAHRQDAVTLDDEQGKVYIYTMGTVNIDPPIVIPVATPASLAPWRVSNRHIHYGSASGLDVQYKHLH